MVIESISIVIRFMLIVREAGLRGVRSSAQGRLSLLARRESVSLNFKELANFRAGLPFESVVD